MKSQRFDGAEIVYVLLKSRKTQNLKQEAAYLTRMKRRIWFWVDNMTCTRLADL